MKKLVTLLVAFTLLFETAGFGAVRGKSAKYVGGTVSIYKDKMDGKWDLAEDSLVFTPNKKEASALKIPYAQIDSLEFGQKVGRRVGGALAGAMIVSPAFLLLLFSKKKKHFLTIGFKDSDGTLQGAVFELAKGIVHESIQTLETKSGKKVEYEPDEARKSAEKGD